MIEETLMQQYIAEVDFANMIIDNTTNRNTIINMMDRANLYIGEYCHVRDSNNSEILNPETIKSLDEQMYKTMKGLNNMPMSLGDLK